jgi:hypothetical protein
LKPSLKRRVLLGIFVCILTLGSGALLSRDELMTKLPVYSRYRCANCHAQSNPTLGRAELNKFGTAFHENGDKWDAVLATADSDEDGFTNGFELGDADGDGQADVPQERSNPGNQLDRPSSVTPETWGVIKKLFTESD